eukprot:SAG22_NODE_249_length_13894_cov_60.455455_14_plen_64_part_00
MLLLLLPLLLQEVLELFGHPLAEGEEEEAAGGAGELVVRPAEFEVLHNHLAPPPLEDRPRGGL